MFSYQSYCRALRLQISHPDITRFSPHCTSALSSYLNAGTLRLAMNEKHLGELLALHVPPPPIVQSVTKKRQWVHMGFPQKRSDNFPSLCQW